MKEVKYYEFINPRGGYIVAGHFDKTEYLENIDKGYRLVSISMVNKKESSYIGYKPKQVQKNKNGIRVVG